MVLGLTMLWRLEEEEMGRWWPMVASRVGRQKDSGVGGTEREEEKEER